MSDFENLGRTVAEQLGQPPAVLLNQQRLRLRAVAARPVPVAPWRRPLLWTAAAAAVLLAVSAVATLRWHGAPVPGEDGPKAPRLAASAEQPELWLEGSAHPRPITLDEDARVLLSDNARARLQRTTATDRRVTVESGRMQVELNPQTTKRWAFLAGAYRVDVLGTAFSVEYDPASGALEVAVSRGRVRVRGGKLSPDGIALSAGQSFQASGNTVQVVTSESAPPRPARMVEPRQPSPGRTKSPPARPDWRTLYRAGDFAAALAAAERDGFSSLLQSLGATDLAKLADAARLSGSSGRARQALRTLRTRFAGSPPAAKAAFLLGRMEGNPRWFEAYLREQPTGAYAPEAAGRLVVAYRDQGDLGRARAAAQQYLARYPNGAYAELARSLASGR